MILICFTLSLDAQIYTPGGTVQGSSGNNNVGIGTNTPQNNLHVQGTARVDYAFYLNDASNSSGDKWGIYGWGNCLQLTHRKPDWSFDFIGINIKNNGYIGIGTNSPAYKLDVVGTIRAKEIIVDINGADFVFEKDYKLMPLKELELFIKEQKHLPEVAPAKEMKENGTDLGNLNSKLLQKMEEMTLYIIEQNKKNEQQNQEMKEMKEKIEKLETASK